MSEPMNIINIPDVPESLTFTIAGMPVTVARRLNKERTGFTYDGSSVIDVPFAMAPKAVKLDTLLLAFVATYDGEPMRVGEPRTSVPSTYRKGPNAGKEIPDSGNRRCVTHTASLRLVDRARPGATARYSAQATLIYLGIEGENHQVRLSVKVRRQVIGGTPLVIGADLLQLTIAS